MHPIGAYLFRWMPLALYTLSPKGEERGLDYCVSVSGAKMGVLNPFASSQFDLMVG